MSTYQLNLNLDSTDVAYLNGAGLQITLAQPGSGNSPTVIWQVFTPFESNVVTWQDTYGLYASTTQISNGATIVRTGEVPIAGSGNAYTFTPGQVFGPPAADSTVGVGCYKVINNLPSDQLPGLTMGMLQSAEINGTVVTSTLNACTVPSMYSAIFEPLETVYVWVQGQFSSQTMITTISDNATPVVFGGSVTTVTLLYNSSAGQFLPSC